MKLPPDYYHCFLGNGLDAVLVGPTGSMVSERVGVDRCYWYKSDRYYPEEKLVQVAGRYPADRPLAHAPGSGWYEIAPLGRTWYEVRREGVPLRLQASRQRFVPQEGTLYSEVDYGHGVTGNVTTWIHPTLSLLVERYEFDKPIDFTACMAPGVWVEEGWDTDPFQAVRVSQEAPEAWYDLGETQGMLVLDLAQEATLEHAGQVCRLHARGATFDKYFAIFDNRQQQRALDRTWFDRAIARGYASLREEHLRHWRTYFATSSIQIPDEQFQRFYDASMYHFKAMQNPDSGGLPVNNLRRTWSSHVFWDAYFIQRVLLEANHRTEALESCRFFQRTESHARRHAREEFGCDGLKWDWEITHDGRKAYGVLLHQKYQVHNTASHANQIWGYYEYTRDRDFLRAFYPLLEGIARFFADCIVREREGGGFEVGFQVGVHESPEKARNDGINLAGTIAVLRHCAQAAAALRIESDFSRRCNVIAEKMMSTVDALYNGRHFVASEEGDALNMSSLAPVYPMQVVPFNDPRAQRTAHAFLEQYGGRMVGHGGNQSGFPWAAGVLATIFARQGQGDEAWQILQSTRPAICSFGGMSEVVENGAWNMQYFGTAEGAVGTAIHSLLLHPAGDTIRLFPALPRAWRQAAFAGLLAGGVAVSARFDAGRVHCCLRNLTKTWLERRVQVGRETKVVQLSAEEEREVSWTA